jgi:hypothetical protein
MGLFGNGACLDRGWTAINLWGLTCEQAKGANEAFFQKKTFEGKKIDGKEQLDWNVHMKYGLDYKLTTPIAKRMLSRVVRAFRRSSEGASAIDSAKGKTSPWSTRSDSSPLHACP